MSDSDNDSDSLFSYSVITHSSLILPCEQRFWLEASTFSNRGEMLQHLPTDKDHAPTAGWKPVPHWAMSSEQRLCFGTGFQPADWLSAIRRLRPRLLKVLASSQNLCSSLSQSLSLSFSESCLCFKCFILSETFWNMKLETQHLLKPSETLIFRKPTQIYVNMCKF